MTQIKSEKAKEYIRGNILDKKFNDGLDHSCVRAETAVLAIHYAEQEAEERHTKELQEVHDMYKQIFIERYKEAHEGAIEDLKEISICDIDAPIFTHTMNFRAHFDYIKKQMIERLNQINNQQ